MEAHVGPLVAASEEPKPETGAGGAAQEPKGGGTYDGDGKKFVGTPFPWENSIPHLGYIREHGVAQFLSQYHHLRKIGGDKLFYGDEIEYGIFKLDHATKKVVLSLRAEEIMNKLNTNETEEGRSLTAGSCSWVPEYGAWMVEATPSEPYGGFTSDLRRVEANMRARRARLQHALRPGEVAPTMVSFPLLGVGDFTGTGAPVNGPIAESLYLPDVVINPHPRFGALTANIRKRRGRKVKIMAPLFQDKNTDMSPEEGAGGTPGVHMDAMGFGMGCCCLQVTFQARDVHESRHLYDALAVLGPIMLALSAACPIAKGKLTDWDCRWNYIRDSVDCRTRAESGEAGPDDPTEYRAEMAGGGKKRINKSRYSGIDMYICNHKNGKEKASASAVFNDLDVQYDEAAFARLVKGGVDPLLAKHVSHLFIRDPLVIFEEKLELDDDTYTDHFESLQSTNWNSVRWKPPPPLKAGEERSIGWRTEFRTMDIQLTDFENAAYTVFITMASRVLLSFSLNTYLPISKNDENMERAHLRDAATKGLFWFRSHLCPPDATHECPSHDAGEPCQLHEDPDSHEEMTLLEILTGKGTYYPGFVPLIMAYAHQAGFDGETLDKVNIYMDFLVKRASGEIMTGATWIRNFVTTHPLYKGDSIVTDEIAFDLVEACNNVGLGKTPAPDLLGDVRITPIVTESAYNVPLANLKLSGGNVAHLLERYRVRAAEIARKNELKVLIKMKMAEVAALEEELSELDTESALEGRRRRLITEPTEAFEGRARSHSQNRHVGDEPGCGC